MIAAAPANPAVADVELPPRWTPLRPHAEQRRLWYSSARFKIVAAGRGSGKTELAKRRIVRALAEAVPGNPSPLYFVAGPTEDQTRRVWWNDLKALTPSEWLLESPSEGNLTIRTIFGSTVFLAGLDRPHRIEGNQYAGGVIDESSDVRPRTWSLSIRPTLGQWRAWVWRIGVPKRFGIGVAEFRAAWDAATDGTAPDSDSFWWRSDTVLTPDEITAARAELSRDDFDEQYNAKWLTAAGLLFSTFADANIEPVEYDPSLPILVGASFTRRPTVLVLAQLRDGRLRFFGDLALYNGTAADAVAMLRQRYPAHRAGWAFAGGAPGYGAAASDYLTIRNDVALSPQVVRVGHADAGGIEPSPADLIANTCRLLSDDDPAGRRILIAPECQRLLSDMRNRSAVEPDADYGYASDAAGHIAWETMPMRLSPHARTAGRVMSVIA